MVKNNLLMQFQADLIGREVIRPTTIETTTHGATYAAGLEIGFWKSQDELINNWQMDKKWKPSLSQES